MKRFFAYPQFILGIAFSFGILMVFVEVVSYITYSGWLLFLANLFWVFGYDTIYAMVDKIDDLKIGIRTSAISLGVNVVKVVAISYSLFIFFMFLVGVENNFHNLYWLSLIIAASLLGLQIWILHAQEENKYFNMFLLNNWVGAVLCVGIILSNLVLW
jgi:4-hydroxybenzoate polyprenyltransferase